MLLWTGNGAKDKTKTSPERSHHFDRLTEVEFGVDLGRTRGAVSVDCTCCINAESSANLGRRRMPQTVE